VNIAVLDHGMGNLRSVARALETAGATVAVTADVGEIRRSDGLCVPGQGIFGRCMNALRGALGETVRDWIDAGRPMLGICLGMQVLFESSEEDGAPGLGLFSGPVTRLPATVTVPHIGWNTVGDTYFYFDHSYAAHPADESIVSGWCDHGERFAAAIRHDGLLGVQFHPEKSGRAGIDLLRGWLAA
jgi:imidazole glycerol-phosphate synthase subunit HisH